MEPYDFLGDAESKSEVLFVFAGLFCPVKTFKNLRPGFLRDARAIVLYPQQPAASFFREGEKNMPAPRRVAHGIVQKNRKNLGNPFSVADVRGERRVGKLYTELNFFLGSYCFKFFVRLEKERI